MPLRNLTIKVIEGKIEFVTGHDAIVNAANAQLGIGSGVNGTIRNRILAVGGRDNLKALDAELAMRKAKHCRKLGYDNLELKAGDVVRTAAYGLSCNGIIHAVAPICTGNADKAKLTGHQHHRLWAAYYNVLRNARIHGWRSVAFPFLGIGIYGVPAESGMRIALQGIFCALDFLSYSSFDMITFVAFTQRDAALMKNILRNQDSLILRKKEESVWYRHMLCDPFVGFPKELKDSLFLNLGKGLRITVNKIFGSTPSSLTPITDGAENVAYDSASISSSSDDSSSQHAPAVPAAVPVADVRVRRRLFERENTTAQSEQPNATDFSILLERLAAFPQEMEQRRRESGSSVTSRTTSRASSVLSDEQPGTSLKRQSSKRASVKRTASGRVKQPLPPPVANFKIWSVCKESTDVPCDYLVRFTPAGEKGRSPWLYNDLVWTNKRRSNLARKGIIHVVPPKNNSRQQILSNNDDYYLTYAAIFSAIKCLGAQSVVIPYVGRMNFAMRSVLTALVVATSSECRDGSALTDLTFTSRCSNHHEFFGELAGSTSVELLDAEVPALFERVVSQIAAWNARLPASEPCDEFDEIADLAIESAGNLLSSLRTPQGKSNVSRRNTPSSREKHAQSQSQHIASLTPEQTEARRLQFHAQQHAKRHAPDRPLGADHALPLDPTDSLYLFPKPLRLGPIPKCRYCGALSYTLNCCSDGKVQLPAEREFPVYLRDLLTGKSASSNLFKKHIVKFNNSFAFGALMHQRGKLSKGIQVVKVNGSIQYQLSNVMPTKGPEPRFGQIYAFTPEEGAASRARNPLYGGDLDPEILLRLSKLFHTCNELAIRFKSMYNFVKGMSHREIGNMTLRLHSFTDAERKTLEAHRAHAGTTNQPEVPVESSFVYQTDQSGAPPRYGIFVRVLHKGEPNFLPYWSPFANSVFYPLLRPYGEPDFTYGEHQYALHPHLQQTTVIRLGPNGADVVPEEHIQRDEENEQSIVQPRVPMEERDDAREGTAPNALRDDDDDQAELDTRAEDTAIAVDELRLRRAVEVATTQLADFGVTSQGEGVWTTATRVVNEAEIVKMRMDAEQLRSTIERIDGATDYALAGPERLGEPLRGVDSHFYNLCLIIDHVNQRIDIIDDAALNRFEQEPDAASLPEIPTLPDYAMDTETSGEPPEECDVDGAVDKTKKTRENVSRRDYFLYRAQTRDQAWNPIAQSGPVGQLWLIDQALKVQRNRIEFIKQHLLEMRGAERQTILFKTRNMQAQKKNLALGYNFRLPASMPGSPANFKQKFENAMAMIHSVGKPDLFITFTGNYDWPEIKQNLVEGTTWPSNAILVNDVFERKLKELLIDIVERQLFGPVAAYVYSIEFQKRGMPHAHILVTLDKAHKLDNPAKIDRYIKARIPELPKEDDPNYADKMRYYENIRNYMMHKPCEGCPEAYCNKRPANKSNKKFKKCTKFFPFEYAEHTSILDDGRAEMARPRDGAHYVMKNHSGVMLHDGSADNRYVVPHNPFLVNKYDCHVHTECVSRVQVTKYIFKYIYKGFDKSLIEFIENSEIDAGEEVGVANRANISGAAFLPPGLSEDEQAARRMSKRIDEELKMRGLKMNNDQRRYVACDEGIMLEEMRQMTPNEAAWGLQGYHMSGQSHTVVPLGVHGENAELVVFKKNGVLQAAEKAASGKPMSALTAWFELNRKDPFARNFKYDEIPLHYNLQKNGGVHKWVRKQREPTKMIVRVRPVNVRYLDVFAIRLLAMNNSGATCFKDLRKVKDAAGNVTTMDTFVEAAREQGLMNSQIEFHRALEEASSVQMPKQLRRMFATILIFGGVTDPFALYEANKQHFVKSSQKNSRVAEGMALFHIASILKHHDRTLEDFNLPDYSLYQLTREQLREVDDTQEEDNAQVDHTTEYTTREAQLTTEQKAAYNEIVATALDECPEKNCYFLSGSGGCGKTFLYQAIYHRLRHEGKSVQMVAHTGIASTLLINGTTAHRRFMLKLNTEENDCSNMQLHTRAAEELRNTDVFIYDEATMSDVNMFAAIDHLLQEIMHCDRPFGGKLMLLGGDWKQLFPVDAGRSAVGSVNLTLKKSMLWHHFKTLTLTRNMRASGDPKYAGFLERLGNGYDGLEISSRITIGYPDQAALPCKTPAEVIDFIYGGNRLNDVESLKKSCLLATLNEETRTLNEEVLKRVPGMVKTYTAIDTPIEFAGMQAPPEYFADEMESGMPPHSLRLKLGAVVILLRNLNVARGLCNGTRMIVEKMAEHFLLCRLISTDFAGEEVLIPKCTLSPANQKKGKQPYTRLQFPIRLAYAMTINKAQGQTFERVGIILNNNVFAHGQLYVALSRARASANVRLYTYDEENWLVDKKDPSILRIVRPVNKVERSVLEDFDPATTISSEEREGDEIEVMLPPLAEEIVTEVIMKDLAAAGGVSTTEPPAIIRAPAAPAPSLSQIDPEKPASAAGHASPQQPSTSARSFSSRMPTQRVQPSLISRFYWAALNPNEKKHLLLKNSGTDCFLNAAIQCLRRLYDIAPLLLITDRTEARRPGLAKAFKPFLEGCGEMSTKGLRQLLGKPFPVFATGQQDVNSVLQSFIGGIAPQPVERFFNMTQELTTICSHCQRESVRDIDTYTFTECRGEVLDLAASFDNVDPAVPKRCDNPKCPSHKKFEAMHSIRTITRPQTNKYIFIVITHYTVRALRLRLSDPSVVDCLVIQDSKWRLVAATIHLYNGHPSIGGHFIAYTRDDVHGWWKHDDVITTAVPGIPVDLSGLCNLMFERIE